MVLNRRQFVASSSLALAASALDVRALLATPAGNPQAPQGPPPTVFVELRGSVGYFMGQGGTIGWHIDKTSVVVIDSQFPSTAAVCLRGLNDRSGARPVDLLINTHHHLDHTAGNGVFKPVTRVILAHEHVPRLQLEAAALAAKNAKPGDPVLPEPVVANVTYATAWRQSVGDEAVSLTYSGPAHTSGDSVTTFEKANVVHMGDLVFNRLHPYIDRRAGASIAHWITVLETTVAAHARETIYLFGHAGPRFEVTGTGIDLLYMRDYLTALLGFVRSQMKAGKTREAVARITDPLQGFPDHGPLIERVLTAAYDELAG
jgi:glyoxylase-like metal-dependent hydrolase (beta-lactamase superfamily II)